MKGEIDEMKKVGLVLIGATAAIILLSQLGPLVGLIISGALLYLVFKQFLKAGHTGAKIGWGALGIILLCITASNLPAILGLAAAYIMFLVIKKWKKPRVTEKINTSDDPFQNFEKQWSELNKN